MIQADERALAGGLALGIGLVVMGLWSIETRSAADPATAPERAFVATAIKGDRVARSFTRAPDGPRLVALSDVDAPLRATLAYADPHPALADPFVRLDLGRESVPEARPWGDDDDHEPDPPHAAAPEPSLVTPQAASPRPASPAPIAVPIPRSRPALAVGKPLVPAAVPPFAGQRVPVAAQPPGEVPGERHPGGVSMPPAAAPVGPRLAALTPPGAASPTPPVVLKTPFGVPYVLQTTTVDMACVKPELVRVLQRVEQKYGQKVVVTSAFRDRGRRGSLHQRCLAVDLVVPGVAAVEVARFLRTIPEAGGVGTYCHPHLVHLDLGEARDWKYGCGSFFALRD